jgi:hypothetical protein
MGYNSNRTNGFRVFSKHRCRLGALPRFLADPFPLPSSASLPKIEADDGLVRAVEGGRR